MTPERAELLKQYVANGGIAVFGCRSAYKDINGRCVMDRLPGLLAGLTGADIPEYSFIAPDAGTVTAQWGEDTLEAAVFTDLVEPGEGGTREAVYTSDYYAGSGAMVSRATGAGKAYYYGTAFTESAARIFLEKLGVANPFGDVKADAYYYKAVLWAVEQGITNGTSATAFSPESPCTRAQVVTFLWRNAKQPKAAGSNPFSDVASGEYYYDAVLWAVRNEITNGIDATHFGPNNTCTRGQIVTFLYRDLAK